MANMALSFARLVVLDGYMRISISLSYMSTDVNRVVVAC